MGMLDYDRFGALGYQPQIQQFSDAITEIMRARQAKAKLEEERSYHQGELTQKRTHDNIAIAHENQRLTLEQAKRDEDQKRYEAGRATEGTKAILERARAGDTPGMTALGGAYGMLDKPPEETRALPPEVAALAAREPPAPPPSHIPEGPEVDPIANAVANVGQKPQPKGLGPDAIVEPDLGPGPPASDVRRFDPNAQGFTGASDQPAQAPPHQAPVSFKLPGGGSFSVDPEQQRTGNRKQMADDFRSTHRARAEEMFRSAAGRPPEVAAQIRAQAQQEMDDVDRLAAGIESGSLVASGAGNQLEAGVRQRRAEGSANDLETRREAGALQRAYITAGAAANRQAANQPPAGEPDPKVESRYQADVSEAKRNSLAPADMKELRTIDKLRKDLENPNGPQHQLAIDNITRLAVGGRAPVALAQALQGSIGLYQSAENWAYRQTHGGVSMPEVLDQYRKAMNEYHEVSLTQRQADAAAFDEQAGIRSHWYQVPEMRARVIDHGRSYYRQLGLPIPPEYGPAAPSAPPSVAPAHGRKRAPAKPASGDDVEDFLNGH